MENLISHFRKKTKHGKLLSQFKILSSLEIATIRN